MGQSTEELTSQIEDTRQRMAADLDTLHRKLLGQVLVEDDDTADRFVHAGIVHTNRYRTPPSSGAAGIGAGQ